MLRVNEVKQLDLGIQGENQAQTITIDISAWLVDYPNGSVTIWHKRNGDSVPSATGAAMDRDAGTISWSPTDTDTYYAGAGTAEIRLTENNVIRKSRPIKTNVSEAVTLAGTTVGSGWANYINAVDGIRDKAEKWATGGTGGTPSATNNAKYYSEEAEDSAEDAEAYAIGKRGGTDVSSDDPAYHNNSMYYAGEAASSANNAETSAGKAEGWATGGSGGTSGATNNAKYYSQQASASATAANTSAGAAGTAATKAENKAKDSEAYAIGKRDGEDVSSGDPAYHNHSKYYSEQASASATSAANEKTAAEEWATGSTGGTAGATNNAKYYSEQAAGSATSAGTAKTGAETARDTAAEWATGGSTGTPSATNNAKYYSEQSASSASSAAAAAASAVAAMIDDTSTADSKVWSASKVNSELGGKVNTSSFYATEMPISSTDATKVSEKLAEINDNKADKNGEYEHLAAGSAEQVLGMYTEEKVPYVYRQTPVASKRVREKIVGGTVAWNQLCTTQSFSAELNSVTFTRSNNSYVNVNGTASAETDAAVTITAPITSGHKYLLYGGKSASVQVVITTVENWGNQNRFDSGSGIILNAVGSSPSNVLIKIANGTSCSNVKVYPMLFDLTAMFGSTIADYLYTLETNTAGAGVAWFRNLFPKDYYAYDAGSLQSVQVKEKKVTGKNKLDIGKAPGTYSATVGGVALTVKVNNDGTINVTGNGTFNNTELYELTDKRALISGMNGMIASGGVSSDSSISLTYRDDDNTWKGYQSISTSDVTISIPSDATKYSVGLRFASGTAINGTITFKPMIRLASVSDNTFVPYKDHTYPFDSSLILRGIPKLDSNNKLYYDGDVYQHDGSVTRKYGIVDLGTLTWIKDTRDRMEAREMMGIAKGMAVTNIANCICPKYAAVTANNTYAHIVGMSFDTGGNFHIYDPNYTDAATFKTAMSGVYLVYELATPTTESAEPYQYLQICDGDGTEEFVDAGNRDITVPVGGIREYSADIWKLIADLQAAVVALQE